MAINHYRPVFSDYNGGPTPFVHILSKPIIPSREAAIKNSDFDNLQAVVARTDKRASTILAFVGSYPADKAIQLNHLSRSAQQPVCFIDCQQLVKNYLGETEKNLLKLIAQAESQRWLLFFDQADSLFDNRAVVADDSTQYAAWEISYLFKYLTLFPGLSIVSLTDKSKLEQIHYAVHSVIHFR